MKNSFEVRVVENIGSKSQRVFGKVGNIISVTDGRFEDLEGVGWCYGSYEEMINSLSEHGCFETKFELLEDDYMECKFKVGDIVKVIDNDEVYNVYYEFVYEKCNQYRYDFISGNTPSEKETYKVVYYGKHTYTDDCVVVIQDLDTNQIYLVSEQGLELCEGIDKLNITTTVTTTVFDTSKLKPYQPIKIRGSFNCVDGDIVTAIIKHIYNDTISIMYCDDDEDEISYSISINEIINGDYEIIKIYK